MPTAVRRSVKRAVRKTASRSSLRALVHASELLTGAGVRRNDGRRPVDEHLGRIEDGAVVYSTRTVDGFEIPDRIEWVGRTRDLPSRYDDVPARDLEWSHSLVPGLVDAHTHLVFAGDRSEEFALRCGGASYEEIAGRGGGILTTVRATRDASEAALLALAIERVEESLRWGVRTIELKSGYGLDEAAEFKQLRVARLLEGLFPQVRFQSTFMGAHAFPKEVVRERYLDLLVRDWIPRAGRERWADACDVFIDRGYFTIAEGRSVCEAALRAGLKIKLHADELADCGVAQLACELGALSADHLLCVSRQGIDALSRSKRTVATLLPATAFYLKAQQAPARKLIDSGACVALATDFNPGTSMTLSLPAVMTTAALQLGMTRAEIFAGTTYNAAKALGFEDDQGTLEPGMRALFTVLPFPRFEETYYRFAWAPR